MPGPAVVLVHGAFADASGFAGVIRELESAGRDEDALASPHHPFAVAVVLAVEERLQPRQPRELDVLRNLTGKIRRRRARSRRGGQLSPQGDGGADSARGRRGVRGHEGSHEKHGREGKRSTEHEADLRRHRLPLRA